MAHGLGWIRDIPDHRDHIYDLAAVRDNLPLPPLVDFRLHMPPVYDQGNLGSCTANMAAAAIDYERGKQGLAFVTPSRLFIYYNERADMHTVKSDSGATIREAYKTINRIGVCPEAEWPYDISRFTIRPTPPCYADALKDRAVSYQSVPRNILGMQAILATGQAIGIGISVYESFESEAVARTGEVPMPGLSEQLLGGHAVLVCGYDVAHGAFIVRNSWGAAWGMGGYFHLPFGYLQNPRLSADFWTVQLVQAAVAAPAVAA